MDFDSIITIILILLFFTFPTILKQLSRKKKTSAAPKKAGKLSLFGKLGEKIREFAKEIEKQAKGKKPGQGWEELADDGETARIYEDPFDPDGYADDAYADDGYADDESFDPMSEPSVIAAVSDKEKKPVSKSERPLPGSDRSSGSAYGQRPLPGSDRSSGSAYGQRQLSPHRLQQAIIWSEILSKPVALRQE